MSQTPTAIVAKNTTYQFAAKAVTVVLSMLTFALVARFLSEEQYGEFTVISTIFALVIGFSDLRVEQVVVRDAAEDESKLPSLAVSSTVVKFVLSLLVIGVALFLTSLTSYPGIVKLGIGLAMFGVLFTALQSGFQSAIQHYLKVYLITFAEVVAKLLAALLIVVVYWWGSQGNISQAAALPIFVVIAFIVSPLIVLACFTFWSVRDLHLTFSWKISSHAVKRLVAQSWPLWLLGLLALVHYRAGVLILDHFKPSYDVGIYGLANRFLDVILTLPPLFIASIYPLLSRYAAHDHDKASSALIKSFNFMLIFVLLLAGGTYYAAPQIITLFGGGGYVQAAEVLQVLTLAMVGSYLASIFVPFLVAHKSQRFAVWASAASVMINIGLNLILIPMYSYYGAAIAIAASEIAGFLVIALLVWRQFRVAPGLSTSIKVIVSLVAMVVTLEVSQLAGGVGNDIWQAVWRLLAIGLLGLGVYGVFIWRLRVIDADILEQSLSMLPIPSKLKKIIHG